KGACSTSASSFPRPTRSGNDEVDHRGEEHEASAHAIERPRDLFLVIVVVGDVVGFDARRRLGLRGRRRFASRPEGPRKRKGESEKGRESHGRILLNRPREYSSPK